MHTIHYYVPQSQSLLTMGLNDSVAREFKIHDADYGINKVQRWYQIENESFSAAVEEVTSDMCSFSYENTEKYFIFHIFGIKSDSYLTDSKSHEFSIILRLAIIIVRLPLIDSLQFLFVNFIYRRYRMKIKKIWIGARVQHSIKV